MTMHFSIGLIVVLCFVAGCDAIYDGINDRLPELGVDGGVLGLNGEEGVLMTGTFTADAGKAGASGFTVTFTEENTFDDFGENDFKVNEITTQFAIAITDGIGLTVTRQGESLPPTIGMAGLSISGTVSDVDNTFTLPGLSLSARDWNLGFKRASCTTTGDRITCGYQFCVDMTGGNLESGTCVAINRTTAAVIANRARVLSMTGRPAATTLEESTEQLLKIVTAQGGTNTVNTSRFVFSFPTPASDLEGATATVRLAEIDTKFSADIL
jgi:hypothetical protein